MSRKVFLPRGQGMLDALSPPTVQSMRERLGGRVPTSSGPYRVGSIVTLESRSGSPRSGVVLCGADGRVDVFLERGLVKRTDAASLTPFLGAPAPDLMMVATQAGVFATLFEGQRVHVERGDGTSTGGVLREKCRYGALVEAEGGAMLGVGFQRLWPAPKPCDDPE